MEVDPDYAFDISQGSVEEEDSRLLEENTREAVKEKIKNIIKKQFAEEIAAKERQVSLITERLAEARRVLDRLRACAVASYYASSFAKPQEKHSVEAGAAQHPAIQNVLRKAATAILSRNAPLEQKTSEKKENLNVHTTDAESVSSKEKEIEPKDMEGISKIDESECDELIQAKSIEDAPIKENLGGRHRIKKTIIVGNVSKYVAPDKREVNDKSSHKWMVYVRGTSDEPRIDHFVRKVWFFLHPSYRPNDLIEVSEAPFRLTRRGWGEFPIRVQLHFCDPRNRRVDIIHNLRLDRTYTGLQTLGAETVCEVELDWSTIGLPVENLLNHPVEPPARPQNQEKAESAANIEDGENLDKCSAVTQLSSEDVEVRNDVRDTVEEMMKKVELGESSSSVEKMDVDAEDVEEKDLSSSSLTEKRRRRRRGDSCCVPEKEENQRPKSMAMMLLCPDEELDETAEANMDQNKSLDAFPKSLETADIELNENLKKLLVETLEDAVKKSAEEEQSKTDTTKNDSNHVEKCHLKLRRTRSKSPAETHLPQETCPAPTPSERPRSLSLDSVSPSPVSVSLGGGKLLRVHKVASRGKAFGQNSKTSNRNAPSPPLVVLRPRASSAGLSPPKFSQTTKGKVTILTPIGAKVTKPSNISGQKRPLARAAAPSSGRIVLNVVPEKKQKLSPNVASIKPSGVNTPVTGRIKLNLGGTKQQSQSSPSPDAHIRLGLSGTPSTPSSNIKFESGAKSDPSKPTKSYILKTTKQGLIVVGQNIVVKETSTQPTSKAKSQLSQAKNSSTTVYQPSKAGNSASTGGRKRKSSGGDSELALSKQVPQEHLAALKAIKSALVNSGVATNRPIQIKIEKGGAQSFNQLKNNQQFVLTTVTNDQGKQQLALVSADRMKEVMKGKATGRPHLSAQDISAVCDDSPLVLKLDSDQPTWYSSKLTELEHRPYHQVVGDKIAASFDLAKSKKDILSRIVSYVPLVAKNSLVCHLPFCAKTEAEFLEWNVGKQRAAEMQRALMIQKILKHACEKSNVMSESDIPSKRYIMNWCLTRGYSVFTDEYESNDVDVESNTESATDFKSSMSTHNNLIKTLEDDPLILVSSRDEDDDDVDIISISPPHIKVKTEPIDSKSERARYSFIHTDEMRAVDKMTQKIGLALKDVPINDVIDAPLTQVALAKTLELFVNQLTRETLASSLIRRDGDNRIQRVQPDEIACLDVADAIQRNDNFQILSDNFMGHSSGTDRF